MHPKPQAFHTILRLRSPRHSSAQSQHPICRALATFATESSSLSSSSSPSNPSNPSDSPPHQPSQPPQPQQPQRSNDPPKSASSHLFALAQEEEAALNALAGGSTTVNPRLSPKASRLIQSVVDDAPWTGDEPIEHSESNHLAI